MQRIAFYTIYPFLLLISLLPFRILYVFSDVLCFLIYRGGKYRKKTVRKNIRTAGVAKNLKHAKAIEKEFYKHFCDLFLEMIKSITISETAIKKRFVVKNKALLERYGKEGKSIIVMCGHYASYEWLLSITYHMPHDGFGVYTPLSNPYFDRMVQRIRRKHGAYLIPRSKVRETLQKHHHEGGLATYGFAGDQSPQLRSKNYWQTFFGVKVPVFTGGERLAKEFDLPVVFARLEKKKRGFYEATIEPLAENPKDVKDYEITDDFLQRIEAQVKANPAHYLWTHNRFKHKDKVPSNLI